MRSEEQWEEVDRCPDCNSPIYKKGDETKFTGPPGCCWRSRERHQGIAEMHRRSYGGNINDPLANKPNARPHPGS